MDLPEIQKILLSNPKPTQAPPEYLMGIGEYSQVLPRDYLGEARQMADSTAGIMGMAIPYGKLPLKKLKEMYEKLRVDFERQLKLTKNADPIEREAAQKAVIKIKDKAVEIKKEIDKRQ
jgi:hypothetical protein